jgi:signal transduction histidine kinase
LQRRALSAAAILAAAAAILWLDGWFSLPGQGTATSEPPPAIATTLGAVASDLGRRAAALAANAEVARSLEGGGIAVHRQALFVAARDAMSAAAPGSWIALADPDGNVLAWWGEAPTRMPGAPASGSLAVRWSATRMELAHWQVTGTGPFSGIICAARSFPVEAPAFGAALGLGGSAAEWEPVAAMAGRPVLLSADGKTPLIAGRSSGASGSVDAGARGVALALALAFALALLAEGPWRMGVGLGFVFLACVTWVNAGGHVLAESPGVWVLALGPLLLPASIAALRKAAVAGPPALALAGFALLGTGILEARRVAVPDLGSGFSLISAGFFRLVALTALFGAALALGACGGGRYRRRGATGLAVFVTAAGLVIGLALVSAWPFFPLCIAAVAVVSYELWRRSVASAASGGALGPFRLTLAAALLVVLVAAPCHAHDRAAAAFDVAAAIRLPDPGRVSAGAVVAVRRAVERVERFDLARDLPAPLDQVDLSDLAYRLWREGEEEAASSTLIAYEVFDSGGRLRSRFSLIPEVDLSEPGEGSVALIERYRVAVVRRRAFLPDAGARWGHVLVSVADWPSWDPLPPRLGVYRRLVGGEDSPVQTPRPVLGLYGPDGARREEGPELPVALLERVRVTGRPVPIRIAFRGEELRGEVRPLKDGFQLVAIPGPDFLQRLLAATQLLAPAAVLYVLGVLVVLGRFAARRRPVRELMPAGGRTFRGRLVALFVLSVMVPLVAVTFYLRSSIATRSRRDTLAHGRAALETARRVLDDYLPSAAAALGRLGLLDDTLLSWLANSVGYDLSVYSPDAELIATSRRDLFAAGLLPQRVPGATYVAIGLGAARERTDARLIAGSRFEEITTELSSVPGVPGVRSPVLLSLLLLPQQRVAEAEAAQLTAAVSAFSLLVFLVSAAIAGRLAVRVARPVADLVEGTRAVARGDFAPQLAEPPDEELRELVRAFLFMSRSLKEQTEALSREKERLATLLSQLTAGVVAYRSDGGVLLANPAAAGLGGGSAGGRTLEEVFPGDAMRGVREVLERVGSEHVSEELELPSGERWRLVTVPLPLGGAGARMAVIEDVSDLVKSNRLAAWAEMARIIAHEIKNPLTPIRLSVEHLREVWKRGSPGFDRVLEECVQNVLRQTETLRHSAAEFSDYARLPRPEMRPTDIGALVEEAAAAYSGAPGVRFEVDAPAGLIALGDGRLLSRVLSNLIGNSVEALARGGAVRIAAARRAGRIAVTVEDDGPGVAPEIFPRLFDPYFSAKSGGTGLGLAIAKKIVEEHGGTIAAESVVPSGIRVRFDLPATGDRELPA